ncbi:MAG: hypothetical protein HC809_10820 [Gammaproteobacteria bacterium]|nr:hypothetical protein [Gammaproteobacteria bacterium]
MSLRARNWMLIAVVMIFLVGIRAVSTQPIPNAVYFADPAPVVIAHQGGDGLRPGNTLLAFRNAWELGADVLEMDVHATADGNVVVIHDDSLERTTDRSGRVKETTLSDVQQADAGYWWPTRSAPFPYRAQGLQVPTLAEVLAEFPGARFNIEIKQSDPPIGALVCRALGEARARRGR